MSALALIGAIDTSSGAFLIVAIIGTIAFATSGVMAAAEAGMDWLGAAVLAVVVAIGGGTLRDLLIGNTPVGWIDDQWPVWVSLITAAVGIVVLRVRPDANPTRHAPYLLADAVGLGSFAVLGTSIALESGTSAFVAVFMGVITGVGGGVIRDILTNTQPMVLVGQVYAVAALIGSLAHVGLDAATSREEIIVWVPMLVVVAVRAVAIRFDLHLPRTSKN